MRQAPKRDNLVAVVLTVAEQLGLPFGEAEIKKLSQDLPLEPGELFSVLAITRRVGFSAVPMEGEFEDLGDVELPLIIPLVRGEETSFVVLHEVDAQRAIVADPRSGLTSYDEESFCDLWPGDVVALELDPAQIDRARAELEEMSDTAATLMSVSLLSLMLLAAVLALFGALPGQAEGLELSAAVALGFASLCAAGSAYVAFGRSCSACHGAAQDVGGLPLGWLGLGLYLGIYAALLSNRWVEIATWGFVVAAGSHIYLLGLLARRRVRCAPCLITGASALLGAATLAAVFPIALAALPVGVAVMVASVQMARRRLLVQTNSQTDAISRRILEDEAAPPPGTVKLVVYTRPRCPSCLFYQTVLAPGLAEEFGDALEIEEREATGLVVTPLFLAIGPVRAELRGLPPANPYDELSHMIGAVLAGGPRSPDRASMQ